MQVNLVDRNGIKIGEMEKLEAHRLGRLHRAFSIMLLNDRDEVLLQKRASSKYHSGDKWSNTCCSHPLTDDRETLVGYAMERLEFEMGVSSELQELGTFLYHAEVGNGFIEHEYDHVFVGHYTGVPSPNADEVQAWEWVPRSVLRQKIVQSPSCYTAWLSHILDLIDKQVTPSLLSDAV